MAKCYFPTGRPKRAPCQESSMIWNGFPNFISNNVEFSAPWVPFFPHIPSILQVPGSKGKLELMYCCSQQRMDFSRVHQPDRGCSLLPWLLFLGSSWLFICSHLQCLLFAFCSLGASLMRVYKVQVVTPVWEAGSVSWVMTVNSTLKTSVHAAVSATRLIPNNVPDH